MNSTSLVSIDDHDLDLITGGMRIGHIAGQAFNGAILGGAAGFGGGFVAGAVAGTIVPGLGTLAGAGSGAIIGGVNGAIIGAGKMGYDEYQRQRRLDAQQR